MPPAAIDFASADKAIITPRLVRPRKHAEPLPYRTENGPKRHRHQTDPWIVVTLGNASMPGTGRVRAALAARFLSVLGLLALWEVTARLLANRLFPPASSVLAALAEEIFHGALLANLALTLLRVAAAFAISMVLGTALGLAMGYWRRLDLVLDSWLTALLNMPALVIIMLAYVWFGLNEAAAIAAVAINKLPATAITIREGTRALDRGLLEMAASFRLSRRAKFRHIILPQLVPYLFAAARSGLSLIWKIVLVVELLGRSNGVGFQIELYFQLFDVTRILAYTIAFIGVVQLIEWGLLQPLERRMTRWRQ